MMVKVEARSLFSRKWKSNNTAQDSLLILFINSTLFTGLCQGENRVKVSTVPGNAKFKESRILNYIK